MNTDTIDIMVRAEILPIDMKIELVDRLLESIGPSPKEIQELWKIEIERRVDEVRSGKVQPIPGSN